MIVGSGSIIPQLKALASELKLDNRVIFTGSVPNDEVYSYIDVMDIAVLTKSNWYGSPIKIFEYGAMQKPIIAPMTSPVLDVMHEDVDALLTEPNEESVSSALNKMLSNKQLCMDMAKAFHAKVMKYYTWKNAARTVIGHAMQTA